MLDAFDYDQDMGVLRVKFANGEVYSYRDVPLSVVDGLAKAPSPGKFFHAAIKQQFKPFW